MLVLFLFTVLAERKQDLEHKLKVWSELEELLIDVDVILSENEKKVSALLGSSHELDKVLVSNLFSAHLVFLTFCHHYDFVVFYSQIFVCWDMY